MAAPTATSPRPNSMPTVGSYSYAALVSVGTAYTPPFDAILIGGTGGSMVVELLDGTQVTLTTVAGQLIPLRASKIIGAGTSANTITLLWA